MKGGCGAEILKAVKLSLDDSLNFFTCYLAHLIKTLTKFFEKPLTVIRWWLKLCLQLCLNMTNEALDPRNCCVKRSQICDVGGELTVWCSVNLIVM